MPVGTTFGNSMLDHFFGGADQARTASVRIALFTTAPNFDTGTGGTEVSDTTYARVTITNDVTNFPAAAARKKSNGVKINFAALTGQATVVAWGAYNAAGTWIMGANLTAAKTCNAGDPIFFDIGDLSIELT